MRSAFIVFLTALLCGPVTVAAQHWMTRERCTVTDVRVHPSVLPATALDRLRAAAEDVPNSVGNYWRITAPGGAVSHIWGTWHSNDPQMLDLPSLVEQHVRRARIAAFEIDPVPATRRAVENAASPRDFWENRGGTLAPLHLPRDIARWVNARFISIGWGDGAADRMTPGAVAEMLLWDPCNDFGGPYPIQDSFLQTLAAIEGAEILGLEDVNALRRTLNRAQNLDLARDIIQLYALGLAPSGTAAHRATAFALYQQGEHAVARLWERELIADVVGAEDAARMQTNVDAYLLDARNASFMQSLVHELGAGNVFIAVGAWHLPGPMGMVARLQEAGFEVTRLPLARERPTQ